ncbi:hypothetical protein [Acrocarpospora catenulata]|nr:hypothetical protein [Acrocarpospora catenulata]
MGSRTLNPALQADSSAFSASEVAVFEGVNDIGAADTTAVAQS